MKDDLLRFQLEAARKQAAYGMQRWEHTTRLLKAFAAWQAELTRARRHLLTLIHNRGKET